MHDRHAERTVCVATGSMRDIIFVCRRHEVGAFRQPSAAGHVRKRPPPAATHFRNRSGKARHRPCASYSALTSCTAVCILLDHCASVSSQGSARGFSRRNLPLTQETAVSCSNMSPLSGACIVAPLPKSDRQPPNLSASSYFATIWPPGEYIPVPRSVNKTRGSLA